MESVARQHNSSDEVIVGLGTGLTVVPVEALVEALLAGRQQESDIVVGPCTFDSADPYTVAAVSAVAAVAAVAGVVGVVAVAPSDCSFGFAYELEVAVEQLDHCLAPRTACWDADILGLPWASVCYEERLLARWADTHLPAELDSVVESVGTIYQKDLGYVWVT